MSVAYRVDDAFVLATDTRADPETAEFAAGVGLLLHEAWYNAADPRTDAGAGGAAAGYAAHSEAGAVAGLAAAAGVGRLVPIHLNPLHDESYYAAIEAGRARRVPAHRRADDGAVVDTDAALDSLAQTSPATRRSVVIRVPQQAVPRGRCR